MLELLSAFIVFSLCMLAFFLIADSDDDNGGGGLMEPALIPIRSNERDL